MLDLAEKSSKPVKSGELLKAELQGRALRLTPAGRWTVQDFAALDAAIKKLKLPRRKGELTDAEILLTAIEDLDTAGAFLLYKLRNDMDAAGIKTRFVGASDKQRILLTVVNENILAERPAAQKSAVPSVVVDAAGAVIGGINDFVLLTGFLGQTTASMLRTALRPWRFRWTAFIHHIEHTGLRAVPIIALICLLIGGVITQQGVIQLQAFGAEPFAIDMLGILALREVGILLTAIMVAGRSASAFTAEIGSMKMREEIDAMRTLGIDPIETLVVPRIAALLVTLPILTFIGNIMCLVGGAVMARIYLDLSVPAYLERLHDAISLRHFVVGLIKAPFAALIIGLVGCREGLSVEGSAESLGGRVTTSVVKAIFLVIIFDALFAMFLSASGY
jgi:phospholipid/cholesterol/gamma-HCH transport system permease protein